MEDKEKEKAEAHWIFLERWLHLVFVDGFIHGWKHGQESVLYPTPEMKEWVKKHFGDVSWIEDKREVYDAKQAD